jgi:hypothetical protein
MPFLKKEMVLKEMVAIPRLGRSGWVYLLYDFFTE